MDANSLRKTLAEQIERLHDNKGDAKVANAIANSAGKIISIIRLELEYCKQLGIPPRISFIKTDEVAKLDHKVKNKDDRKSA